MAKADTPAEDDRQLVLVVEDEEAHAEAIRRSFESRPSFDLRVVSSLGRARQALSERRPDLVIADVRLPDGEGTELLQSPRNGVAFPLVIMTSHGDEKAAVDAMRAGALDYVVKSEVTLTDMPHIAERTLREWRHIAERGRAGEELSRSQAQLSAVLDAVGEGIVTADAESTIVLVNKEVERIWRYPSEELVGRHLHVLMPDKYRKAHTEGMRRYGATREGKVLGERVVLEGLRKDGSTFPLEICIKEVNPTLFTAAVRDITERLKAESELRASEQRLRTLIETSHDMIQSVAADGRILEASRAWLDTLGYTADELAALHLLDVIHPDSRAHVEAIQEQVLGGTVVTNTEATFMTKNGRAVVAEGNVIARYVEGEAVATHGFWRDVSDARDLQQQLVERARLAAVGTTVAMLAHEIGNPLNNMYLHGQLLQRHIAKAGLGDDELLTSGLDTLMAEVLRLNQLLQEFRSLSRRQTLQLESVDIAEVIKEVVTLQMPQIDAAGSRVEQNMPLALPRVIADREKLKQVLLNLCKNALEAMSEGGTLTLTASSTAEDATVKVTDTGAGIPEDVDPFEPFHTTKAEGTGLGLAVAQQIVNAHGGVLSYESAASVGTTFTLTLPLEPPAPSIRL